MIVAKEKAYDRAMSIGLTDGRWIATDDVNGDPSPFTGLEIVVLERLPALPEGVGGMGYDYLVALDVSFAELLERYRSAHRQPRYQPIPTYGIRDILEWHRGADHDDRYAGLLVARAYEEEISVEWLDECYETETETNRRIRWTDSVTGLSVEAWVDGETAINRTLDILNPNRDRIGIDRDGQIYILEPVGPKTRQDFITD